MADQHPLDMWYERAGEASDSPLFCSTTSVDCWSGFPSNTTERAKLLSRRLTCVSGGSVPEYYVETMANMSTDFVKYDSNGAMYFSAKVCQCNPLYLLGGKDCTPSTFGYVIVLACIAVWLWVFGLLFRAVCMMKSKKMGSRKKRILVVLAALQYFSQLVWITGWFKVYFIESHALLKLFQDVGFTFASLFLFLFICGMVNQTAQHLHEGVKTSEVVLEKRLRRIQMVFGVLPFITAILTGILTPMASSLARLLLLIIQYLILLSVIVAFNFVIDVLDERVHRLVPDAARRRIKTTIPEMLKRWFQAIEFHFSGVKRFEAKPNESALDLLGSFQQLYGIAISLRNALICYMLVGGAFFAADVLQDSNSGFLVLLFFCMIQLYMSSVPVVGVGGLSNMRTITVLVKYVTH